MGGTGYSEKYVPAEVGFRGTLALTQDFPFCDAILGGAEPHE